MAVDWQKIGSYLTKQWNLAAGVAAWVLTAVTGFWPPPEALPSEDQENLKAFGRFFLIVFCVLMLVLAGLYRERKHLWYWFAAGGVFALLIPVAYFSFRSYDAAWTCNYPPNTHKRVVIGPDSGLTDDGKDYRTRFPRATNEQMVSDFAGNLERIWKKDSIENRKLWLAIMYACLLPVFGSAMICGIQAGYCLSPPQPDNTPQANPDENPAPGPDADQQDPKPPEPK